MNELPLVLEVSDIQRIMGISAGSGGIRYPEDHGDLESDSLRAGTQAGFSGVPFGEAHPDQSGSVL